MKHPESDIQQAAFEEIRFRRKESPLWDCVFSIPNQGVGRNKRLQLEGAKAGVWDILIAVPRGMVPMCWIEVKTKTGYLSEAQVEFGNLMRSQGCLMYVCRSTEEIIKVCQNYLFPKQIGER